MRKGCDGEKTDRRKRKNRQAGAELGQAQLKLGLEFNSKYFNYTSLIVLAEQTNFPFYTYFIRQEIAELAIASYS